MKDILKKNFKKAFRDKAFLAESPEGKLSPYIVLTETAQTSSKCGLNDLRDLRVLASQRSLNASQGDSDLCLKVPTSDGFTHPSM